ncbi:hypothetical protein [Paraburkholderia sp. CNPSo 3281]|uniref:hypothetical protein n=1 Tax=Paraburkholderia sp. CNPSo 3281 TaxID=2940933 RepID=UPI0020B650A8|nr:hypothetical protein [Paraburkholderia sp. CNPSo 3281]MCP3719951.1 hypothetical protein [Paraburkholderia sp. CNPSo 3281]
MRMECDADIVQTRDAIRQKAFELADSGMLDGWQAVRRTLRACFDIESVEHVHRTDFRARPHDPGGENAASGATSCWPRVDHVVLRAMDALARHA